MEAKILRPLLWFGLLEHRSEKIPSGRFGQHHFYRKAELFDRLLAFDVQVDPSASKKATTASGSLATFASFTILPRPSTTQTLESSKETSIPA
jgi:hypothetical protein